MDDMIHEATDDSRRAPLPAGHKPERPHISELVKNWVGVVAFVGAAIWAICTFIYLQFMQPKQVPVNISLNLDMQKVPAEGARPAPAAAGPDGHRLVAVELSVKATNPSSRSVYLLPSAWLARGYKVHPAVKRVNVPASASERIRDNVIRPIEKYADIADSEAVAGGRLFADDVLKPNETISRRIVFHLPPDFYDVVEVYTNVPSSDRPAIGIRWSSVGELLKFDITRNGKPLPANKPGDAPNDDFQTSESRAAMSLWRQ
jgi:hypothetical protein